jgi:DNA-binding NarL/FixJ family response regulator
MIIDVAIVEDHKTTRDAFERIINLSDDCRCVCACADAEEGLRVIPEHEPDVVLMDIQLPKMSGVDCVAKLKESLPATQVIMVTVYEDPDTIFRALRAGACGYVLKRASADTLLGAVREVRRGGVPMSVEIARKVIAYFQGEATAAKEAEKLSNREREVLDLVAKGYANKEIADQLGVTTYAILWHLKNIYQKLHVHSRTQAVRKLHPHI